MSDLLVALVVVPVLAALVPPLAASVRPRTGWSVAVAALATQVALALVVLARVAANGPVTHAVGGFPAPYGVELVVDGLSAPFLVLVAATALGVLAYARSAGPRSAPFYAAALLLVAGLTGVCVTGDAFTLYVFLEISGLAAYALVAQGAGGRAALAALQYLLLGTVGATCYLLGVAYLYAATGTLNLADLAATLPRESTLSVAAFALVTVGLGVKLALFPLHGWQPDAYEHAPDAAAALLSALASTVAGYALLRVVAGVFGPAFAAANPLANDALLLVACASVVAGGALAFRATSLRRLLAYSSVAQFGLAAVGVGLGTATALTGAAVQLLGHAVAKGGLFAAAGVLDARTGATEVDELAGLASGAPWASAALAVLGATLVGLPPTVGFTAKWYLALAAVETGAWGVLAVVVASTFVSLTYFGRLVQALYVADPADSEPAAGAVRTGMVTVPVTAAVGVVVLGLGTAALAALVDPAVTALLHP